MLKTMKRKVVTLATLAVMAISLICGGMLAVNHASATTGAPVLTTAKAAVRLIKEDERDSVDGIRFMNQLSVVDYTKLLENDTVKVEALLAPSKNLKGATLQVSDIDEDGKIGGATVVRVVLLEKADGVITQNYFVEQVDQETQEKYYGAYAYLNKFPFAQGDGEADKAYQTRLTNIYRFGIACRSYYQIGDNDPVYSVNEAQEAKPAVRSMEQVAYRAIQSGRYAGTDVETILQGYLTKYSVSYTLDGTGSTLQAYETVTYGEQTTKNDFVPQVALGERFIGWKNRILPLTVTGDVVLVAETESLFKNQVYNMNTDDFIQIFSSKDIPGTVSTVELVEEVDGLDGAAFKITLPHYGSADGNTSSYFGIKSEILSMMKAAGYTGITITVYNPDFDNDNGRIYTYRNGTLISSFTSQKTATYTLADWENYTFNRAYKNDNRIYVQLFAHATITDKGDTLDLLNGSYMSELFSLNDASTITYAHAELANKFQGTCFEYTTVNAQADASLGSYLLVTRSVLETMQTLGYTKLTMSVYCATRVWDNSQNKFHLGWTVEPPTDKTVVFDLATILADTKFEKGIKIKIHPDDKVKTQQLWITQMTAVK